MCTGYGCQAYTNCTVVSLEGFDCCGLGHMSAPMLLQDLIFETKCIALLEGQWMIRLSPIFVDTIGESWDKSSLMFGSPLCAPPSPGALFLFGVSWDPHILRQHLLVLSLRPGRMVTRTRKTNSAARSLHAGEPSVRAPDDRASASTSRHRAESASSSRGTRVSELQGMLANLTDMVTGLTAQQAMILRQTQLVCAVLPPTPVAAVPVPPLPVAAIPELIPPVAAAPTPPPPVAGILAPAPPVAPLSIQSSGSSIPPERPIRFQEVHQNHLPPCPLPQPAFLPPAFPPFLAGRDPSFLALEPLLTDLILSLGQWTEMPFFPMSFAWPSSQRISGHLGWKITKAQQTAVSMCREDRASFSLALALLAGIEDPSQDSLKFQFLTMKREDNTKMGLTTAFVITSILALLVSPPTTAQSPPAPPLAPFLSPTPAPAPAPAPQFVNLTDLLSVAGPFHTFLNFLLQTDVIQTFQNQANNTDQGITIFVPKDSAFSELKKPSLSNLTKDQLKSLLLYHAFPKYYSLSDFKNLSSHNPVSTFAGGQYSVNVTDSNGLIRVGSDWSNPKITSSVYSTKPVAVYELDSVLLPKAIVTTEPALTPSPAPAPAPGATPTSVLAPTGESGNAGAPKSSEAGNNSSPCRIAAGSLISMLAAMSVVLLVPMI
ncbi:Fasciclin-like arabinogalactan protein 7 [Apostasia shenzhenica]|uniref:Fasciclin-like arabinogalactan protein 7 n=1 Tax=Apostasia shenzhenica TaxID=1088818 RepID=A0A2I0AXT8_9ASPA|nr:Fasciclin-like arabinogalactan protein 7 [Apostasia shenzhenica]